MFTLCHKKVNARVALHGDAQGFGGDKKKSSRLRRPVPMTALHLSASQTRAPPPIRQEQDDHTASPGSSAAIANFPATPWPANVRPSRPLDYARHDYYVGVGESLMSICFANQSSDRPGYTTMPVRPFPLPYSVGVDICFVPRIRRLIQKNVNCTQQPGVGLSLTRFVKRIFHEKEIPVFRRRWSAFLAGIDNLQDEQWDSMANWISGR